MSCGGVMFSETEIFHAKSVLQTLAMKCERGIQQNMQKKFHYCKVLRGTTSVSWNNRRIVTVIWPSDLGNLPTQSMLAAAIKQAGN